MEKLSSESNQFVRTSKAAIGSVRTSFKSLGNLVVRDVFQIRNDTLLRHFRETRSSLGKRAKVKGLFCLLKDVNDVKRMIALSFRISPDEEMYAEMFPGVRYDKNDANAGKTTETFLREMQCVKVSDLLFSKYSTVPHSEKDHNISGLRYLVLCRVLIDRMFVTSKHRNVFPDITDEMLRSFDAVYCPSREEFRVLNAAHVLPEFIIQCRWMSKTKDSV